MMELTREQIDAYVRYRSGDQSPETVTLAMQAAEIVAACKQEMDARRLFEKTNRRIEKIMKISVPVDDTYEEQKEEMLLYRSRLCAMASRLENVHRAHPSDTELALMRFKVAVGVSKTRFVSTDISLQRWDDVLNDAEQLLRKYE